MDKIEEILDALAERRDYHAAQANEFLDRAQGFAQVNAMRDLSEAIDSSGASQLRCRIVRFFIEEIPMKLTLLQHAGNPNMCRIPELTIRAMPECEGGGWYLPRRQAELLILAANLMHGDISEEMTDAFFKAQEDYAVLVTKEVFPRPHLPAFVFHAIMAVARTSSALCSKERPHG